MRLGYFTMPLHPPQRDPLQTLQEDREAVVLADKLGFHDAFVGEQLTDRCENVTNSFIFLATLVGETNTIKLATGTSNLSQSPCADRAIGGSAKAPPREAARI